MIEKADGSVYGDGVNVAARLQSLAAPGGVVVSAAVRGAIGSRMAVRSEDLGLQAVKNIAEPVHAFRLFETAAPDAAKPEAGTAATQPIRFCSARDGAQLAWTSQGSGPPLVLVGRWMTHLEFEMEPGSWSRRIFDALSAEHTLIRYDARANGLSDWNVDDISFEAWVSDLESVLDAAGVDHHHRRVGFEHVDASEFDEDFGVRSHRKRRVKHVARVDHPAQGPEVDVERHGAGQEAIAERPGRRGRHERPIRSVMRRGAARTRAESRRDDHGAQEGSHVHGCEHRMKRPPSSGPHGTHEPCDG